MDKRGFRARGEWKAVWEGRPTAFGPFFFAISSENILIHRFSLPIPIRRRDRASLHRDLGHQHWLHPASHHWRKPSMSLRGTASDRCSTDTRIDVLQPSCYGLLVTLPLADALSNPSAAATLRWSSSSTRCRIPSHDGRRYADTFAAQLYRPVDAFLSAWTAWSSSSSAHDVAGAVHAYPSSSEWQLH